jgi:hypothetical protein
LSFFTEDLALRFATAVTTALCTAFRRSDTAIPW